MREKDIVESKIRHLKLTAPLCVESGTPAGEVIGSMKQEKRSCVLICREKRCIGIFTERDYLNRILGHDVDLKQPVDRFMSAGPETLTVDDTVGQAVRLMQKHGFRNIPLVDESGLCAGLVQIRNVIEFLAELYPEEVLNAPPRRRYEETDGA